jgi:hypothetical protein
MGDAPNGNGESENSPADKENPRPQNAGGKENRREEQTALAVTYQVAGNNANQNI